MRRYTLAVAVVVLGCGGGGGNNGNGAKLKAKLDLSHVIGFAIAPSTAGRLPADPCMPSTLYALGDDGTMSITTVTETTGSNGSASCSTSSMMERATAIFDTPGYVVINYTGPMAGGLALTCTSDGHCDRCDYVLAQKSD